MKRLSRRTTLASLFVVATLGITACGSSSGSSEGEATATTAAAEPTATEPQAAEPSVTEPVVTDAAEPDTTVAVEAPAGGEFIDGATFGSGVPPHIDPALTSELDGAQVTQLLYDGLTEFANEDSGPVLKPLGAEKWEANADATEFIFTLKKGLKFSNGEDVLPSSYKLGWDIAANPALAADYSYLFALVKGFTEYQDGTGTELTGVVADDAAMTLTVTLANPYADFPSVASHIIFSPMPKDRSKLTDQSQWEKGVMIGNGPFMQEEAQNEQEIALVKNPEWAGDVYGNTSAKLDKVTFKIFADIDAAYASFEAGETMSATIPSGKFAEATGKYGNTAKPILGSYHWVFGMRDEDPIGGAANLKLRQAISLAIDRPSINDSVYDGSRTLPSGVTPPGIPGFKEGICKYCVTDVDAAKALLEEFTAGGGTVPTTIKLVFNAGAGHEDVAAIVQQNLADIGIAVEQEPRSTEIYFKSLREGGCPGLCRAGWFWDYPIYDNGMYDLFHKDSIGGNNLGFYDSAEFNATVDEARKTIDTDKREELFRTAEDLLLNGDTAVSPMNWYNGDNLYADGVTGYSQEALGWVRYELVSIG